jgi:hypothetical protein
MLEKTYFLVKHPSTCQIREPLGHGSRIPMTLLLITKYKKAVSKI